VRVRMCGCVFACACLLFVCICVRVHVCMCIPRFTFSTAKSTRLNGHKANFFE